MLYLIKFCNIINIIPASIVTISASPMVWESNMGIWRIKEIFLPSKFKPGVKKKDCTASVTDFRGMWISHVLTADKKSLDY